MSHAQSAQVATPVRYYRGQPPGTRGIDLFIGEATCLLTRALRDLFASGAPCVLTDPDPANTPWGHVLLMRCDRPTLE